MVLKIEKTLLLYEVDRKVVETITSFFLLFVIIRNQIKNERLQRKTTDEPVYFC